MRANTLRRLNALERDIQGGVLDLLRLMPEVAWVHKQFVGEGVIVRPTHKHAPFSSGRAEDPVSVRQQLYAAADAGFLHRSQIGYIQGAPVGVLDTALQLTGIGTHCELEVKQPGRKPTKEQWERILNIRAHGGFADWVDDIDQVQPLILEWSKQA